MLAWKVTKKGYSPVLICDVCHQQIDSPRRGNYLAIHDDGNSLIVGWMAHKGKCDTEFANKTSISGWQDMVDVLEEVGSLKFDTSLDRPTCKDVVRVARILAEGDNV